MKTLVIILLFLCVFIGLYIGFNLRDIKNINFFSSINKDKVIARVNDNYLYESDINILEINNKNFNKKDYINEWAKKKLFLDRSKLNISEDSINELTEKYKNDLLLNYYKNSLIDRYLDKNVSDEEILDYYNKNKHIFKLNERIIKAAFIELKKKAFNLKKVNKWFSNYEKNKEYFDTLIDYCRKYSYNFFINDSIWSKHSELSSKFSNIKDKLNKKLMKKGKFQIKDSIYLYLFKVKDIKNKGQIAPLSYFREVIIKLILNNRKFELIKNIEDTLFIDAVKNKSFEIY